jgi:hypothetical protein
MTGSHFHPAKDARAIRFKMIVARKRFLNTIARMAAMVAFYRIVHARAAHHSSWAAIAFLNSASAQGSASSGLLVPGTAQIRWRSGSFNLVGREIRLLDYIEGVGQLSARGKRTRSPSRRSYPANKCTESRSRKATIGTEPAWTSSASKKPIKSEPQNSPEVEVVRRERVAKQIADNTFPFNRQVVDALHPVFAVLPA